MRLQRNESTNPTVHWNLRMLQREATVGTNIPEVSVEVARLWCIVVSQRVGYNIMCGIITTEVV